MFKKKTLCLSIIFTLGMIFVQPECFAARVSVANAFYRAASVEGIKGVKRLIDMGYKLEQTDSNGNTALCLASLYQNESAFSVLVKAGASTKAKCFASQGKRYPEKAANEKMIYLGGGLSDTIYGENRKYLESGAGTTSETAYAVGALLLLGGGIGVALASHSGGGRSGIASTSTSSMEEILSAEIPACLGGYWTKKGDGYECTCPIGKALVNGACVDDVIAFQTTSVVNEGVVVLTKEKDALLAELGASLTNDGVVTGVTGVSTASGDITDDLVALKVNGFSAQSYSGDLNPDVKLRVETASRAINNGIITLTQQETTPTDPVVSAGSLYGIKALAGATARNTTTGQITLNVSRPKASYAMYAEQIGYGLTNEGIINLNLSQTAKDVFGLYSADQRGAVNTGVISMKITDPEFNSAEIGEVAAIYAADAQNWGTILLRRGEDVAQEKNNLNVTGIYVKANMNTEDDDDDSNNDNSGDNTGDENSNENSGGDSSGDNNGDTGDTGNTGTSKVKGVGRVENTSTGLISLDVTKTPFFVHGMYADQGTSGMVNEGRIEIYGDLASEQSVKGVGGAYAMRWTGGYGSILNKGQIESRTCLKDANGNCRFDAFGNILYEEWIDVPGQDEKQLNSGSVSLTGDAYLTLLSGFRGSITNQADLILSVVNNETHPLSLWTLMGINLFANAEDGTGVLNQADIKVSVTEGTVKKGSNAIGISATTASVENTGNIFINSKTDNLDLYGIAASSVKNGQYSKISILGEGSNTMLYGLAKASYENNILYSAYDPNAVNEGYIILEHHNTGGMFALAGQNSGSIELTVKPDTDNALYMPRITGMVGETNEGPITLSMQKGSFAVESGFDNLGVLFFRPSAVLLGAISEGASLTNSAPISFYAENRLVNPFVLTTNNEIVVPDEEGLYPSTIEKAYENTDTSYFGGVYGIAASAPEYHSSYSISNESLIKLQASETTPDGKFMNGWFAGVNAVAYNITNQKNAKIDINLNGPGHILGMYAQSHIYTDESEPTLYTMINEGTIDIKATNTADEHIRGINLIATQITDSGNRVKQIYSSTGSAITDIPFAVVGMMTNSLAVNNGDILLQVGGDARVAGMVAYDGGIIVNNGRIDFSGDAANFTALYGTGYRTILDTTTTQQTSQDQSGNNKTTTTVTVVETKQYSTVYNYGTIIINSTSHIYENLDELIGGGDGALNAAIGYYSKGQYTPPSTANQTVKTTVTQDGKQVSYNEDNSGYVAGKEINPNSSNSSSGSSTQSIASTTSTVVLNQGVDYVSEGSASFEAEGSLVSGSVIAGLSNVMDSNQTMYVASGRGYGAVVGNGDDSLLSLTSASYLFDADFKQNENNANGFDIVMTLKSFDDVVDNKSLASFLSENYTLGNNEAFFNEIKSIGNANAFKSTMDSLTGQNTIAKFTHEDLTSMREVNFTMNEQMFANDDKQVFEKQGSVNGFSFKNDNHSAANYALGTKRIAPRWKVGYAMSNTTINTDDDHDTTRHNQIFQVFAPIGYENSGIKLISTPQIGFARGHYTRKGYNDTSYNGTIEKRIFALMNEARYPVQLGGFEFAPTVEFNTIAYNQKGSEGKKEYALTMPSDNQLSVEAGLGLYANKTIGNMKFNAGLMMYREFADPYNVKMGMNGMDGTFNLYDDTQEYRGVASFGFNYDLNDWNLYGKVQHFMESDNHTNVKTGLKYTF